MKITLLKEGSTLYPHAQEDTEKLEKLSNALYVVDIKNLDMRTNQQNRAIHLWASQIAQLLNSKEMYMTGVFGNKIMWSMESVKAHIIKGTIKQVFDIDSTTKLKRKELDQLVDYVTIAFANRGVMIPPFPSKELWNE